MGGTTTTVSGTNVPGEVEQLLRNSATGVSTIQNNYPLTQFLGYNPQQVAGANAYQNYTANTLWGNLGRTPGSEQSAAQLAYMLPGQVGQTPLSYFGATGQRPGASQQAIDRLFALETTAPDISSYFYSGRPMESWQAGQEATRASSAAQQALGYYQPVAAFAMQRPADFAALQQQVAQQGQNLMPTGVSLRPGEMTPAIQAAHDAFIANMLPQIENQAATSGLGRSTALTNATSQGLASYMLPVVQDELNREFAANQLAFGSNRDIGLQAALASERGVERGTNILAQQAQAAQQLPQTMLSAAQVLDNLGQTEIARTLQTAQAEERGTERRMSAINTAISTLQAQGQQDLARQLEMATAEERALSRYGETGLAANQQLLQLGAAETGRAQSVYGAGLELGDLYRQIEQQGYDAAYNERLRQQAIAEQALYQPFGAFFPSAMGQRASQTGGGLFK